MLFAGGPRPRVATLRNLIILIFIGILLALARWLIVDVINAVKRVMGSSQENDAARTSRGGQASETPAEAGRLVRDPVSGTYIDERLAVKAEIDGETFYFESRENRDAYLKKSRAG